MAPAAKAKNPVECVRDQALEQLDQPHSSFNKPHAHFVMGRALHLKSHVRHAIKMDMFRSKIGLWSKLKRADPHPGDSPS